MLVGQEVFNVQVIIKLEVNSSLEDIAWSLQNRYRAVVGCVSLVTLFNLFSSGISKDMVR